MLLKCEVCGKEFNRKPSYIAKTNNPTCSRECKTKMSLMLIIKGYEEYLGVNNFNEWLVEKYEVDLLSIRELCKLLNTKSNRTVMKLLNYYNVNTRHGSEAIKTQWTNNEQRRIETSKRAKKILCSVENRKKLISKMQTLEYREKTRMAKLASKNPMYNFNLTDNDRIRIYKNKRDNEYNYWRRKVYERDLFTCQITGEKSKGDIVAHHLNGYDKFSSERFHVGNGITLRNDIHKLFHKLYGYGGNTKEQFEEFKRMYNDEI